MCGGGLLPVPTPPVLHNRALSVTSLGVLKSTLETSVSVLTAIASQPPLMGNVDPTKVDEIRRTVYVGNLNSQSTTAEQLLEFFTQVGDVKFVRMAGDETQPTRFAFVEFADQESVMRALNFNGVMFRDRPLKINHSNNAIVKPPELTPQAAAKELEDVMKKVRVAQSTIAAAIEPEEEDETKKTPSSCSRRSRSRSRSSQRKQSRSKHRSRQRTSNTHRRRSTSRERRRSRSRSRSRDHRRNQDGQMGKNGGRNEKRTGRGKDRMASSGHGGSRRSHGESRGRKDKKRNKGCVSGGEKHEGWLSAWKRDSDGKAISSQVKQAVDECDGEMEDQPPQLHLNGS